MGGTFPVRLIYDDRPAYAKGGLVNAALAVKKAGRHGDTEIIHINKAELAELTRQWGKPTINPETGMPEFFLGKIGKVLKKALPVAALAANFIPGAGPLISAGLGAASGALNAKGGLGKRLLGGALGAAPGLLGGGFRQLGVPIGLGGQVAGAAGQAAAGAAGAAPQATGMPLTGTAMGTPAQGQFGGMPLTGTEMGAAPDPAALTQAAAGVAPAAAGKPNFFNQDSLGLGIKNKYLMLGGALGAMALSGGKKKDKTNATLEGAKTDFTNTFGNASLPAPSGPYAGMRTYKPRIPGSEYTAGSSPEHEYFGYASGGSASLAVQGAGDGRADTVNALLSDGEYVMDAETVAMLGNGSNKAGADALDRLRVNLRKHKGKSMAGGKFSAKAKEPDRYLRKAG